MTTVHLPLEYDLKAGWLSPFVEGLTQGRAVARVCAACGRVSFPPLRTCTCGSAEGEWVILSGRATVITRTSGTDGDFALARFDGADGLTTVALQSTATVAQSPLVLQASDPPRLVLGLEDTA